MLEITRRNWGFFNHIVDLIKLCESQVESFQVEEVIQPMLLNEIIDYNRSHALKAEQKGDHKVIQQYLGI